MEKEMEEEKEEMEEEWNGEFPEGDLSSLNAFSRFQVPGFLPLLLCRTVLSGYS